MSLGKDTACNGVDIYNLLDTGDISASVTTCTGTSTGSGPKVAIRKVQPIVGSSDGKDVLGTIDANIYLKNNRQDNLKYIIENKNKEDMTMEESIKEINKDAPHQQDQLNYDKGATSHLTKTVCEDDVCCIVRRLTTTETSRLQGFPDDYTKINGPETSDSPQYKTHGNSWATPCAFFMSVRMELEMRRLGFTGQINYATCCSGIEAHSVAVKNLDWKSIFFSEIEPFPCDVLKHHYPQTPNLGDMTQIHYDAKKCIITNSHKEGDDYDLPSCFRRAEIMEIPFKHGELQVFSGGTPCQSVSIAGKREGMAEGSGTRSSLAFHYQRIIDEAKPAFTLWENVVGAFSSNGGKDFIWFVNKCAESGYSMAWRVLDAQYTTTEEFPRAVPQRRRRIWLVGYRGKDWRVPARVVFELKKDLTEEPPIRIPGKGFKTLNPDFDASDIIVPLKKKGKNLEASLFGDVDVSRNGNKKVAKIIPFDEMPAESDFSKLSSVEILNFVNKIGECGYIGPVFRTDKKSRKKVDTSLDLFSFASGEQPNEEVTEAVVEEWEGAEKIAPAILENIGNAGILANGVIATINCHEWTGGIQLSPKNHSRYMEFTKNHDLFNANLLLPAAYDGTVCGLSDVLEDNPDSKYNLSWRACFGILKRAAGRGKELPQALEVALIANIRENAGIVKWAALNGRETKKKDGDLSERETAMLCFNEYISPIAKFEDVVPVEPVKRSSEGDDAEDDGIDETGGLGEDVNPSDEVDWDGNWVGGSVEPAVDNAQKVVKPYGSVQSVDTKLDASRIEDGVSPTLLASSYKEPPAVMK